MLIQFSIKNYRSIKDEAELQMITDAGKELLDSNTFQPDAKGASNFGMMKSAVVYGANAAGKSNIINALSKMQWLVLNSATKLQSGEALDIEPFKFSVDSINEPTEFNMDFISEGIRYQYGFSANNERVLEEWLFAYPNGRAQTWFMREYDQKAEQYNWTKDSYLSGAKSTWKEATRDNALFLSTAIQLNSKQLSPVYHWFSKVLRVIGTHDLNTIQTAQQVLSEKRTRDEVLSFLKAGDLGIEDIRVHDKYSYNSPSIDNEGKKRESWLANVGKNLQMPQSLDSPSFSRVSSSNVSSARPFYADNLIIETGHRLEDGSFQYLDLKEESDGTQRMFAFAAPLVESLQDGAVVFIDELNNSLHPTMVKFLVSLFNSADSNANKAQLVFTTHETSILSQDVFRRDQIWFCEKNKAQSTTLYSLSEFSVRKGADNIERNYLSGKYGALPFIDKSNLGDLHG